MRDELVTAVRAAWLSLSDEVEPGKRSNELVRANHGTRRANELDAATASQLRTPLGCEGKIAYVD